MFGGIYYGAMYGGSTTSILLNTPGETGSIATAIDGHMMAKQGRGAAALTTAAGGSFVAAASWSSARTIRPSSSHVHSRRSFSWSLRWFSPDHDCFAGR